LPQSPAASPALALQDLRHSFGRGLPPVVDAFSLDIGAGEVVCLLGPSGCGKTTVLRLAAGLEAVQQGRIALGGETIAGPGVDVPPERRRIGLVFQDYALFPHLTLRDNVAFGLDGADAGARAEAWLRRVGLTARSSDYPHRLSGGEQQRVALARALAPAPRAMLMDEPFASLDTGLRLALRREALDLLRASGAATMLVTHDPDEALAMADRIAVMRAGRLVQVGVPAELYARPVDRFVAGFLGEANLLDARVSNGMAHTPFGPVAAGGHGDGSTVTVLARPEALRIAPGGVVARVVEARRIGGLTDLHLRLADDTVLDVHAFGLAPPAPGTEVGLAIAPGDLCVLAD